MMLGNNSEVLVLMEQRKTIANGQNSNLAVNRAVDGHPSLS